jgi:hypothetical protein
MRELDFWRCILQYITSDWVDLHCSSSTSSQTLTPEKAFLQLQRSIAASSHEESQIVLGIEEPSKQVQKSSIRNYGRI